MKRTLKVLLGVVALALIGVSTASAQTGALLGKDLFLFDGGTGSTQNYVQLISPDAGTLTTNWTLTLPPDAGGTDFILVNTDGAGTSAWQDGNNIFWKLTGNTGTTPWDGTIGNYYGTGDAADLALRSGGQNMFFWFNSMSYPLFTINENGELTLRTGDGFESLVIGGEPGGTTGPDAGIVFDCILPPIVAMEINAVTTGILMPANGGIGCAPAPITGIDLQAQLLGLRTAAPTALWAEGAVDIDLGVGEFVNISGTTADATATEILLLNGSDNVVTRTIGAGADIITGSGTLNRQTRWTGTNTIGDAQIIDDGAAAMQALNHFNPNSDISFDLGSPVLRWRNGHFGSSVVVGPPGTDFTMFTNPLTGLLNVAGGLSEIEIFASGAGSILRLRPDQTNLDGQYDFRGTGLTISTAAGANLVINESSITRAGDITIDAGAGNNLILPNVPLSASSTKILALNGSDELEYRTIPANGDIVVSAGPLTGNGAVTTNASGQLISTAMTNGQVIIGSTGNAPVFATITEGTGIDITNGAGTITISSEIPDGTTDNSTLRWDAGTTAWVENTNLLSTAAGNTTVNGTMTIDPLDVTLSATDTRVLTQNGSGLVGYRTIPANGDIVVSAGPLTGNGAVTTNASGQLVSTAMTNGQVIIGSTGNAPVFGTITAGTGISVTNGAGSITIANTNPTIPAPGVGNTNWTLRSDGTNWVASGALQNNGTNVSMTGNLDVDGNLTLGTTDANTHSIIGVTSINTSGNGGTNIGHVGNAGNVNVYSGTGSIVVNSQLSSLTLTGGTTFSLQSANGGSINTIANTSTTIGTNNAASSVVINSPVLTAANLPTTSTATGLVVREAGDLRVSTATFPTTSGALGNNTALRTNGSGQIESVSLPTGEFLAGTATGPAAFNLVSPLNSVSITVDAANTEIELEVANPLPAGVANQTIRHNGTNWVASNTLTNDDNTLTYTGSTNLGNDNLDNTTIVGDLFVNTTVGSAVNVSINSSAQTHSTTIGNAFAGNTTNLNSPTIVAPNLPAGANTDELVTVDGTGNIRKATVATMIGGDAWVRGGNSGALSGEIGTNDAVSLRLEAGGKTHMLLDHTIAGVTAINTTTLPGTGDVFIGSDGTGVNGPNSTHIQSSDIQFDNIPVNNATNWILVYDNSTGAVAKKDVGTPVQTTKTAQATITGDGATAVFNIVDAFVAANSIIMVTLQDGGGNPDNNNYTVAIQAVNAGDFDIRLSGIVANTETKIVNYTIVNP